MEEAEIWNSRQSAGILIRSVAAINAALIQCTPNMRNLKSSTESISMLTLITDL